MAETTKMPKYRDLIELVDPDGDITLLLQHCEGCDLILNVPAHEIFLTRDQSRWIAKTLLEWAGPA